MPTDAPQSIPSLHAIVLLVLALFAVVCLVSGLARRLGISYPILLIVTGVGLSVVPGLGHIPLPPELVFYVFLPPLLFTAAWETSWRALRYNLISVAMLALGLVTFTIVGVTLIAPHLFESFDPRLAFLLGAIVSPTDAVAASAIARKVGMPARIVETLEGESLLNDATGLLALEFGLSMVVHDTTPTVMAGLGRLGWLVAVGVLVGAGLGLLIAKLEQYLDDGPVEMLLSLLIPYAAYFAAEGINASGVLAVVTCGLYLSRRRAQILSPDTRIQQAAVWEAMEFILNGAIFLVMGLQFRSVLSGISGLSKLTAVGYGLGFSVALILLRLAWMFPGGSVAYSLRRLLQKQDEPRPPLKYMFVTGWVGMRGVIALAAATALPLRIDGGHRFPHRNLIVFLVYSVIIVTVVLQGLALPWLIRLLKITPPRYELVKESEIREQMLTAAIAGLERDRRDRPEEAHLFDDLLRQYQHRLDELESSPAEQSTTPDGRRVRELTVGAITLERDKLIELMEAGHVPEALHKQLEHELDLRESQLQLRDGGTAAEPANRDVS